MRKKLFLLLALSGMAILSFSQSLSINTDGSIADTSAMLDVKSTEKGILIPRMTKSQRADIFQPAAGLLVYQSGPDSTGFYFYDGSRWQWLITSSTVHGADSLSWKRTGNTNIIAPPTTDLSLGGDYLGTADERDFVIGVKDMERMRFRANNSFVGLGSTLPQYAMDVTMNYDGVMNCDGRNGFRIKSPFTHNNINAGCDEGYFMGYSDMNSQYGGDVMFWNFNGSPFTEHNSFRWGYGPDTMGGLQMKLRNHMLGLSQPNPLFALDIRAGVDAIEPCMMNGLRLTTPLMAQGCDRGLFFGYASFASNGTIWNYGDPGSTENFIRIGTDDGATGEIMRLGRHRVGINVDDPQAVLHLRDISGIRNGIRITSPLLTAGSFYMGASFSGTELELSTEFEEPIRFYTNTSSDPTPRMSIHESGNVNIGPEVGAPHSTLKVEGTIAVGVSSNVAGGSSGAPTQLTNLGSYITLAPSGGADYYELPRADQYAGRIFYIRNTSNATAAMLTCAIGNICEGSTNTCNATYQMLPNGSGKTVMVISDGTNWTAGSIN